MSHELKPCPFCGSKAGMYYPFHMMGKPNSPATYNGGVRCDACGAETKSTNPPDEAIALWNRRVAPDHPADDDIVRDATALRWMAKHPECELSADFGPDGDEDLQWVVHRVAGSRNDREWHELGRGATPMRAISAAMQADQPQEGGK